MPVTQQQLDEAMTLLEEIRRRANDAKQSLYGLVGRQAVLEHDLTLPREPYLGDLIRMAEDTHRVAVLAVADAESRVRDLEWRASNGMDADQDW